MVLTALHRLNFKVPLVYSSKVERTGNRCIIDSNSRVDNPRVMMLALRKPLRHHVGPRASRAGSSADGGVRRVSDVKARAAKDIGMGGNSFPGLSKANKTVENVAVVGMVAVAATVGLLSLDSNPWEAYQTAVKMNPIETKACISGVVYSIGDLIAQNYEGRDISELDRGRIIRSGLCGLLAHGPLSHLYYVGLDSVFAQQHWIDVNSWISPVIKVGIDQTVWSIFWNSTYYILLGLLKAESPKTIISSVQQSWWDLLKAGWRLWPIVHICTYGIIPVQHRLLFVDAVELVWVCILSTYGQQQREARKNSTDSPSWVACALPSQAGEGGDFTEEIIRGMTAEHEIVFETKDGEVQVKSPEDVFSESN